ncbi:11274_t:CDS:2 [Scutellospora calospora]|uniref:11274_t:CDS:1 n=1 Tax=Scutellospora calospora TaxID=85575 RepID=A0ACA9K4J2_9GLOM|nr:11274_t:CDS:2 [Scutellospora calospora]
MLYKLPIKKWICISYKSQWEFFFKNTLQKQLQENELLVPDLLYLYLLEEYNRKEAIEDKPHLEHPHEATTLQNIAKIKNLIIEDPYATTRELACLVSISQTRVTNILTKELGMIKICIKWVLHVLTNEQKKMNRSFKEAAKKLQKGFNNIITSDKT